VVQDVSTVWLTHSGARSLRSSLSSDRLDQHTTSACPARPPPRGRRSVTASPAPQAAAAAEAAEARELVEEVRAVVYENYLDARGGGWDAAAWDGACQRVLAGPLRDRAAAHRRAPVRPWRPRASLELLRAVLSGARVGWAARQLPAAIARGLPALGLAGAIVQRLGA